jgi:tetratricopeptide (TPR) repeat protein
MEAIASSGSIAITEHTRRLVEGYFQLKSRGPTHVRGLAEPINVYEVMGLGPLRTRLQRAAARGLTKFVGRQREMDALKHAAKQAMAGRGQIVAVMAEPGIGKSRLFYEFKATSQSGWMVLEAFSVSHGKASAYLPVLDLLSQYFEINRDDDDRKRRERVLGKVLGLDRTLEDTLPYLYSLQSITEAGDSLAQMDPQIRRRRTLEAIKRILLRESLNQPLMIIFEDLHWIDSETQAFLNLLVDTIANARILLLVNYRPEYRHEWGSRTHYTQLRLDPLSRESAEEMLSALLTDEKDPIPLRRFIIERTEGTPFFMEEIVQPLFEDGVLQRNGVVKLGQPMSTVKVPTTVQAVLASRIDRLAPAEKELLQTLAVLGREFSLTLVQRVTTRSSDELQQMLSQLQLSEFINEQPAVGEVEFSFKHALTYEVAYNSILAERRRALHERAGHAIEELYAHPLEDHYGDLARHYLRSDDAAKAVQYARLAAEQAASRGTFAEAAKLVEAGLSLLDKVPEVNERQRAELALRAIESTIMFVSHGGPSLEREHAVKRVCELAEMIGAKEQSLRGLMTLCNVYFTRGEPREGFELAKRCISLAKETQDPSLLADAFYSAGIMAFSCGRMRDAASYFNDAVQHMNRSTQTVSVVGFPYGAFASIRALPLPLLGCVSEGFKQAEEGLRFTRKSGNLFFLGLALTLKAIFDSLTREPGQARVLTEEAIALSQENGFAQWLNLGHCLHGWALLDLGLPEEAIAEMEEAIAACGHMGGMPRLQYYKCLLGQGYARIGESEKALATLNKALEHIERTGEKIDQADILRLKGEILLMRDRRATQEAEGCFRLALEVARMQEAKWWELRTTVSLARLLRDTNRRDEARSVLAEIYNWFTEGFELPDLKDAKVLLDELASSPPDRPS